MAPRWGFAYPGAQIRNPLVNITSIIRPTPDGEETRPVEELWTVFGSQILGFRVLGSGFLVPGEYPSGCRSSPILASPAPRTRNLEPRSGTEPESIRPSSSALRGRKTEAPRGSDAPPVGARLRRRRGRWS